MLKLSEPAKVLRAFNELINEVQSAFTHIREEVGQGLLPQPDMIHNELLRRREGNITRQLPCSMPMPRIKRQRYANQTCGSAYL